MCVSMCVCVCGERDRKERRREKRALRRIEKSRLVVANNGQGSKRAAFSIPSTTAEMSISTIAGAMHACTINNATVEQRKERNDDNEDRHSPLFSLAQPPFIPCALQLPASLSCGHQRDLRVALGRWTAAGGETCRLLLIWGEVNRVTGSDRASEKAPEAQDRDAAKGMRLCVQSAEPRRGSVMHTGGGANEEGRYDHSSLSRPLPGLGPSGGRQENV